MKRVIWYALLIGSAAVAGTVPDAGDAAKACVEVTGSAAEIRIRATCRGSQVLHLSLGVPSGETLGECDCHVAVAYEPVKIRLTTPSYRDSFYPGQACARIAGVVDCAGTGNVALTARGAGAAIDVPVRDGRFAFDVPGMLAFPITLSAACGRDVTTKTVRKVEPDGRRMTWILQGTGLRHFLAEAVEKGDADCGGITATNWISAEPLAGVEKPFPYLTHTTEAHLTRANIIRAELKAVFATLVKGMDILRAEGVYPKSLVGHGGLFKTPGVAEKVLSDLLGIPVVTRATAGEGGAWGIARLAAVRNLHRS